MRLLNIEISTGPLSLPHLITRQTHTIKIGDPLKWIPKKYDVYKLLLAWFISEKILHVN